MTNQKPEFNIGDSVTYQPYEKALPVKVIDIHYTNLLQTDDTRIFYKLSGDSVNAETTGKCIKESNLFRPATQICVWCGARSKDTVKKQCNAPDGGGHLFKWV